MPFVAELFSAPVLERIQRRRRRTVTAVPFFEGLLTGQIDALVGSFSGEPEVHHPVRGRVKGAPAFARFVSDTTSWMAERDVTVEDVNFIVTPVGGVEEFTLLGDGMSMSMAITADLDRDARMSELRIYSVSTGDAYRARPPLLQPDPGVQVPDVVGDYQRALARGDVEAAVAAFEPDGSVSEPAGGPTHLGGDELRAHYEALFSDGGIALEHCAVIDDGRACALEYNVVARGRTELPPDAGAAVYVRGDSGKIAAARIYANRQRRTP
jgi:hypothetical protein